jgi:hypothetical protein
MLVLWPVRISEWACVINHDLSLLAGRLALRCPRSAVLAARVAMRSPVTLRVSQINHCALSVDINSATLAQRGVQVEHFLPRLRQFYQAPYEDDHPPTLDER